MGETIESVERAFRERTALIGVVGLGYVGLPLLLALSEAGFPVAGFDIDGTKMEMLDARRSYIRQIPDERVAAAVARNGPLAPGPMARMRECAAIIICVPTPLSAHGDPDLSFVIATAELIVPHLRRHQLVVLESTTYPGTTRDVLRPVLERQGLRSGEDLFLAYSPEREDPGNVDFSTDAIPKVVGADDAAAHRLAVALYEQVVPRVVPVANTAVAEAVKLTENIFRSVNIALVNELKIVFDAMGIDVWDVIGAAATKPFGFMPFYPGPGLGGHCIPIDPFYLTWKAKEFGVATRFIELAGQINTMMPHYVVDRLIAALDRHAGKALSRSRILIVGMAYKKNVDDSRESPGLRLMELLRGRGAAVDYHDPHIPVIPPTREHAALAGIASQPWSPDGLRGYDAALIVTDHDGTDYRSLAEHCPLIVDTRNAMNEIDGVRAVVVKA
jgi:UDP-N-acetyl-D-glucosamine dehydrogenase